VELADGDFIDLDWSRRPVSPESPLVLVLHGLEGSSRATYVRDLMSHLSDHGIQVVAMNFRGCSGTANRLARTYHSGETGDLDTIVSWLRDQWPHRMLAVVGYSLGGNVLLKWLGERGSEARVDAGVAVSVPMELGICAERMEQGFSQFYLWNLLRRLRKTLRVKYSRRPLPFSMHGAMKATNFRDFDGRFTAPLNGFRDAEDYYTRSSSRQYLPHICQPTLILHSRDDPFMTSAVLPADNEIADSVQLEVSEHGGHVGFVACRDRLGLQPRLWLPRRILRFLSSTQN
jgi:predicted alpha/beta-fold hydrolase